jgi:uncharacterized protein YgiM (DUF1202 family)
MHRSPFSTLIIVGVLSVTSIASANNLDVPILEHGGDGIGANCGSYTVSGLPADGDGFLAVRSGPGSQYRKIDELRNGEIVIDFDSRGQWLGVVYRTSNVDCSSTKTHPVAYEKKVGFIKNGLNHVLARSR